MQCQSVQILKLGLKVLSGSADIKTVPYRRSAMAESFRRQRSVTTSKYLNIHKPIYGYRQLSTDRNL